MVGGETLGPRQGPRSPSYLLDVPAVGRGLGHDHAEGVENEAGQPQELHAVADEG